MTLFDPADWCDPPDLIELHIVPRAEPSETP